MLALSYEGHNLLELAEVSLLLGGQERKPLEERYHVLSKSRQVGGLVVPHSVRPASKSAASQVTLEEGQYDPVLLRHVEAERDLPRNRVILSRSERDIETSFSIRKARQVIPYLRWDLLDPRVH